MYGNSVSYKQREELLTVPTSSSINLERLLNKITTTIVIKTIN
jgi:hypothetical protein